MAHMVSSVPNQKDYEKQTVAWACGALRKAGWYFEAMPANEGSGWYVETPKGWEDANNASELTAIARRANGNPI